MTRRSLDSIAATEALQFGHGGDAVDDTVYTSAYGRQSRCFNSATAVTPWMTSPRLGACSTSLSFNSATAVTPWMTAQAGQRAGQPALLQFGHGGDAVDDDAATPQRREARLLQFGHGGDAVDDDTAFDSGKLRSRSFNSATAVTPWMTTAWVADSSGRTRTASIRPRR